MKLYIIRHGESENNLKDCWTGWYDAALTEKGREDARKAGELLKGIAFDSVYCSDLQRARETARIALPGYEAEATPLIREVNVGNLANKPISFPEGEARKRMATVGYGEFGGEDYKEFAARLRQFMDKVKNPEGQTVAAVCHGGCMRTFLDIVMGQVMPHHKFVCGNCAVAVYEYKNDSWRLHSWMNIV